MQISRAMVMANEGKPIARKVKKDVQGFLRSRGIAHSPHSPQLLITVGGDGTVLCSKRHYGIPFFAIGSSTSFICQAKFSDWKRKLSSALSRQKLEKRLLLESRLNEKALPLSLNEIGIRNPEPRVLSLHLSIGKRHFAFRADGIMFCTPTGSPAYCYSCGGKQMKRGENAYQAVAISPFRRLFSPTIIPAGAYCTLRISGKERAQLFIDGQEAGIFTEKKTLAVRGSKKKFLFLSP